MHVSEIPSFLRSHNISLYIYITFCLSNSFVDGPLGCVHVSAIVNYAAMNRYLFKTLSSIIWGIYSQVKLSCEDLSMY